MSLFQLVNQNQNRQRLEQIAQSKRIANAYLFHGAEGHGTEGFALEFAAMLNCLGSADAIPCGECASCRKLKNLEHSNLSLVFPIPIKEDTESDDPPFEKFKEEDMEEIQQAIRFKASHPYGKIVITKGLHIPINFIREIKRKIYLTALEPGYKVVVIFDAHLLTEPAANAFLKILEEPPSQSTFILTTSVPDLLLPTIHSRCQALHFPPVPETELLSYLTTFDYPSEDIKLAVRMAGGNVARLMNLLEGNLKIIKKKTLTIYEQIALWKPASVRKITEDLAAQYRDEPDQFRQILESMLFFARDVELLRNGADPRHLIHTDLFERLQKFANKYTACDTEKIKSSVENCIGFLNRNVYINLAITEMLFQIKASIEPDLKNE